MTQHFSTLVFIYVGLSVHLLCIICEIAQSIPRVKLGYLASELGTAYIAISFYFKLKA